MGAVKEIIGLRGYIIVSDAASARPADGGKAGDILVCIEPEGYAWVAARLLDGGFSSRETSFDSYTDPRCRWVRKAV